MRAKTLGVIPARFAAQRFPGKPLALIAGKPLVQWVAEACMKSRALDAVIVATDNERIAQTVEDFGGKAMLTSPFCASGTDRAAEIAQKFDCEIVLNVQGDEPLMRPEMIDALVQGMNTEPSVQMGTMARKITDDRDVDNPNVVKVVCDRVGDALYFSRAPIPFVREYPRLRSATLKHLGIYAFRKDFLLQFVQLPPSKLEQIEKLEQLRALENGHKIRVWLTEFDSIGVDTPEDVKLVEKFLLKK
jgi:3-deoxy-manno-octulosonate cytidylyltransferase (CMP-KDO synthetase)